MTPVTSRKAPQRRGDAVAVSRVRFLTAESVDPGRIRSAILASWRRSRDLRVPADKIEQPYDRDCDTDTPLNRTAEPVLRKLREQLDGQPMSIILTDPAGLVLSRRTGNTDLDRHLDRVMLAPGFNYAEQFVGTNGIGTALEVGGPMYVFGHEHYAENLEDLACAGVPIRHPVSGRTLGALDLTCWAKDAGPLLLTLAKSTAEQIRQACMADASALQLQLLQEYLRTCRRAPGIVFAVGGDMVLFNDDARAILDPVDQAALVVRASEALSEGHHSSILADLPSGATARMYSRPVQFGPPPGGVVVHVKLLDPTSAHPPGHGAAVRVPLPGLVGSAPVWLRACDDADAASRSGEWVAVAGEPGVGKLALLQAVQHRRRPGTRSVLLDAAAAAADQAWSATARKALREDADNVIVCHVDRLDSTRLEDLSTALQEERQAPREHPLWVAVTLGPGPSSDDLIDFLRAFPSTVDVPPLRLHLDDLPQLVTCFLDRLGQGERLDCSPEAMQLLVRGHWPGNAAQVLAMLRDVVKHRRGGSIQPDDLPPAVRAVSRRRLSQLESLERDAVVQALVHARGDKCKAASSLGISRATIYRKIHEYGIVPPTA